MVGFGPVQSRCRLHRTEDGQEGRGGGSGGRVGSRPEVPDGTERTPPEEGPEGWE